MSTFQLNIGESALAVLESVRTVGDFIRCLVVAGVKETAAKSAVEDVLRLTSGQSLAMDLKDVELEMAMQSTPLGVLSGTLGAPPWCFTARRMTRYCSD